MERRTERKQFPGARQISPGPLITLCSKDLDLVCVTHARTDPILLVSLCLFNYPRNSPGAAFAHTEALRTARNGRLFTTQPDNLGVNKIPKRVCANCNSYRDVNSSANTIKESNK